MSGSIKEGGRLSPQQARLWSLQQYAGDPIYRSQCSIIIEGPVDLQPLKNAFRRVYERYEILRTTFHLPTNSTEPRQIVINDTLPVLEEHDWSAWDPSQQRAATESLIRDLGSVPFDLVNGPVLRLSLITLAPTRRLLLINIPSLLSDSASLTNLVREISRLYAALASSQEQPDRPLQYADLAEWERDILTSAESWQGRQHWRDSEVVSLFAPTLSFETMPPTVAFEPKYLSAPLPLDIAASIRRLASKYAVPVSAFFFACWQLLLFRLTGQSDLIIGLVSSGRTYEELQHALGLFSNTLPVKCFIGKESLFKTLLQNTARSARKAFEWEEYFDSTEIKWSDDVVSHHYLPFAFEYHEAEETHSAGDAQFTILQRHICCDRFKLKVSCIPTDDRFVTDFHYDAGVFSSVDIARVLSEFQALIEDACAHPESLTADLNLIDRREYRQILVKFNDALSEVIEPKCIHDCFAERVQRAPDNVAVVSQGRRLTYAQLDARANQLAHYLQSEGVRRDVPVAICMNRSTQLIVGILGILKAGGAYVPLDPEFPKERLAYLLEDVQAQVILTEARIRGSLPDTGGHVICLDSDWEKIERYPENAPLSKATPDNLAYIIYTSGSTGRPKGVMVEHGGLYNALNWIMTTLRLSPSDRCILKTPITFDAAGREFFPTLLAGGTLIIAQPGGHRDSRYLAETICNEGVSVFHCVPSLLKVLIQEPALNDGAPALRAVMCGGEALPPEIVTRFHSRLGAALYNVYGPTEAIIDSTCHLCEIGSSYSTIPIGRPIPNVKVHILDDLLRPLPIGAPGDMYIGGAGLARGYVGRSDLTAEKFIPDPFGSAPGARLYRTGDRARYRRDGNIEFLGRIDHQVKLRGFRIELGEIEVALVRHPAVREAVVMVREDRHQEQRLVAYVAPEKDARLNSLDLRTFLKQSLPEHMLPVSFVVQYVFPLTISGKLDRSALPTPEEHALGPDATFVASRTPTEELLVEIWSQVLNVTRIGIHDDFFQIGGHSLLATQVVSRIRETFSLEMPLRCIFEAPTIVDLAKNIDGRFSTGTQAPPIVPVPRDGELALSFAQQRLWFLHQLEPASSVYNFPAAVRIRGPLNIAALTNSLNEIVSRHEILRTTFPIVDGRPTQVIAPLIALTPTIISLQELPQPNREIQALRLMADEARLPFDLSNGPLVRTKLIELNEDEHVGLLTMHHIVSDGWSTGILIQEMALLYEAFCAGRASPLLPLSIQYADFAHWQQHWLKGEVLQAQLNYWKEQLTDAPSMLDLPTDRPRPSAQTFRGAHQTTSVPETISAKLKTLGREHGATLFMTLLAAFEILLHWYTNQDDIIIGTPIANRNRIETEGLIGFFVNTLVLRADLSGDPGFGELVGRVRDVCLGAYAHQDLPFERLVDELQLERSLNRNPLFQVMFVLQHFRAITSEASQLTVEPIEVETSTTHFDLTLHLADTGNDLIASLAYNTDLFDPGTIARMLRDYELILATVCGSPGLHLSEFPLSPDPKFAAHVIQEDLAGTDQPPEACVQQLFEAQVERSPEAIAVCFEHEQLTYEQVNRRANQLAFRLRTLGVGPEVPVGLCLTPSAELLVGLLGILKAGGIYIPFDPEYPKARLAFMFEDAQIAVLVTQESLLARLPRHHAMVICLDTDRDVITKESGGNPSCLSLPAELAYVIYTSGSTGRPKRVGVPHSALAAHCVMIRRYYELDRDDCVLQFGSMSFDLSLEQILPTLLVGAKLVMSDTEICQPKEFHSKIAELGLTVLNLPTAYWHLLVQEWEGLPAFVPSIRPKVFIVGGDKMLPESLALWQRTPMNEIRLINAYGPTEATVTATAFEIPSRFSESPRLRPVPIGVPLAGREAYILNKYGNPVPIGVSGELHVGGDCLARGYLDRADLTAEAFLPNPFTSEPGARLYKTGDLARYRSDGNIEFLGRTDDQVKYHGFRIELGEIEAALRQCPNVRSAVVLVRDTTSDEKQLIAYLVAEREPAPTPSELRAFLKERLPGFMVPSVFVPLDALPLTPNGKVDRRALPEPDRAHAEQGKTFVTPRDPLEFELTVMWEEILGIHSIGVTDSFFELGGHSLAAVRLFALIEKRLGKKVPLATIFQGATVEHLANILRRQDSVVPRSSLVPIQAGGTRRPLFLIHPAGGHIFPYVQLANSLGSDQPCYGLQAKGLEEGQEPHKRIDEMAAYYVSAMQTVQSQGPYLLAGWSMGGVVAFEMAQQLYAQGQRVALLGLLDTRIPTADEEFADEDFEMTLLVDFVRYFGLSLDSRNALKHLPKHDLLERVLGHAKRAGLIPSDIEVSQAQPFIELCKADFRATRNYQLCPYPGRISLFRASQELEDHCSDPSLGWSKWATGGIDVHLVPGNHATMVYKPHVAVLAEQLGSCLEQAQNHNL